MNKWKMGKISEVDRHGKIIGQVDAHIYGNFAIRRFDPLGWAVTHVASMRIASPPVYLSFDNAKWIAKNFDQVAVDWIDQDNGQSFRDSIMPVYREAAILFGPVDLWYDK